jgi:hypothetical protein
MNIDTVKKRNEDRLMRLPNVIGVGIGEKAGKQVIKVFVTHKIPISELNPKEVIPKMLGIYETDIEEIGVIMAQN